MSRRPKAPKPMRRSKAVRATWEHFYNPVEAWKRLVSVPIHELRKRAQAAGAPTPYKPGRDVDVMSIVVHTVLKDHHDEHYAPAYLEEIARTPRARRVRAWIEGELRELGASQRGVEWAMSLPDRRGARHVITAFRPRLPARVNRTDSEYARAALRRIEAKAQCGGDGPR